MQPIGDSGGDSDRWLTRMDGYYVSLFITIFNKKLTKLIIYIYITSLITKSVRTPSRSVFLGATILYYSGSISLPLLSENIYCVLASDSEDASLAY